MAHMDSIDNETIDYTIGWANYFITWVSVRQSNVATSNRFGLERYLFILNWRSSSSNCCDVKAVRGRRLFDEPTPATKPKSHDYWLIRAARTRSIKDQVLYSMVTPGRSSILRPWTINYTSPSLYPISPNFDRFEHMDSVNCTFIWLMLPPLYIKETVESIMAAIKNLSTSFFDSIFLEKSGWTVHRGPRT